MTLSTQSLARLGASFGSQAIARMQDPNARAMAMALVATERASKVTRMEDASARVLTYDDTTDCGMPHDKRCKQCRVCTLYSHAWPRTRAIRNAERQADIDARDAHKRHDADALYAAVLRAHRLSVLGTLADAASVRVGSFPLSIRDMRADTSRFLTRAHWRRFMFKGGRDVGSREYDDSDVLQGAFLRALDAGDTLSGVPAFGSMFRHVQAERAHLTRISGAEWRGIQDALHGARATERAYPATDDKHALRRLGTCVPRDKSGRFYGTRDTHAQALAIAAQETERALIGERVTHEARSLSVLAGDAQSFPRVMSEILMAGASIAEIASALGLNEATVRDRAIAERDAAMASGVDHSEDAPAHVIERERDVMLAQATHAERLHDAAWFAHRVDYMRTRRARVSGVSAMDSGRRAALRDNLADEIANASARVLITGYRDAASVGDMQAACVMRAVHAGQRAAVPFAQTSGRYNRVVASALIRSNVGADALVSSYAAYAVLADKRDAA